MMTVIWEIPSNADVNIGAGDFLLVVQTSALPNSQEKKIFILLTEPIICLINSCQSSCGLFIGIFHFIVIFPWPYELKVYHSFDPSLKIGWKVVINSSYDLQPQSRSINHATAYNIYFDESCTHTLWRKLAFWRGVVELTLVIDITTKTYPCPQYGFHLVHNPKGEIDISPFCFVWKDNFISMLANCKLTSFVWAQSCWWQNQFDSNAFGVRLFVNMLFHISSIFIFVDNPFCVCSIWLCRISYGDLALWHERIFSGFFARLDPLEVIGCESVIELKHTTIVACWWRMIDLFGVVSTKSSQHI